MFPGANAQVYYNEAGEPLGWDYPSSDEGPSWADDDWANAQNYEMEPDELPFEECVATGQHGLDTSTIGCTWDDATHEWVGGRVMCDRCGWERDMTLEEWSRDWQNAIN